jgi:hypothetical protein
LSLKTSWLCPVSLIDNSQQMQPFTGQRFRLLIQALDSFPG